MKVFADYHHADLYESLLMLFEDRLGWEVYRPTGIEWAQRGWWLYSDNPGVQKQFLQPWPTSRPAQGHYKANEIAHPARVHKFVYPDQFKNMEWGFILASVTQHMKLYKEIARANSAKFIAQVGNANQAVPWELDPLVLASAKVDLSPGRGVHFHPEFNIRDDYKFVASPNPRRVVNLMNCLKSLPKQYGEWKELQRLLEPDGFEFFEYGILGDHGIIGPSSRIAAEMRDAGWAYHNKHADGYGFVVHQWQACGRPIIGRSGPYRGETGEPLWKVLPSLDLDENSVESVANIMRSAADAAAVEDGFYQQACKAMHRDFRSRINFTHEADAVRKLLEG